jgi:hypothetical protein
MRLIPSGASCTRHWRNWLRRGVGIIKYEYTLLGTAVQVMYFIDAM